MVAGFLAGLSANLICGALALILRAQALMFIGVAFGWVAFYLATKKRLKAHAWPMRWGTRIVVAVVMFTLAAISTGTVLPAGLLRAVGSVTLAQSLVLLAGALLVVYSGYVWGTKEQGKHANSPNKSTSAPMASPAISANPPSIPIVYQAPPSPYSAMGRVMSDINEAHLAAYEYQRKKEMIDAQLGLGLSPAHLDALRKWLAHGKQYLKREDEWMCQIEAWDEVESWRRGVIETMSRMSDPVLIRFKHIRPPDTRGMSTPDAFRADLKPYLDLLSEYLNEH